MDTNKFKIEFDHVHANNHLEMQIADLDNIFVNDKLDNKETVVIEATVLAYFSEFSMILSLTSNLYNVSYFIRI